MCVPCQIGHLNLKHRGRIGLLPPKTLNATVNFIQTVPDACSYA